MKKYLSILSVLSFLITCHCSKLLASSMDYSVMLSSKINASKPSITLKWKNNSLAKSYKVYHSSFKNQGKVWILDTLLAGTVNTFEVKNPVKGKMYEFKIQANIDDKFKAFGYISTGIEVENNPNQGGLILVVEDSVTQKLNPQVLRLISQMRGEGWQVSRINVNRKDKVTDIKTLIINKYLALDSQVNSIYLLGRVPVPYSGFFAPDGHEDHKGAWPSDVYYTDMEDDNTWTDYNSLTTASRNENKNGTGDGKFDNDISPYQPRVSIGRVDLSNMAAFGKSETDLLKQYLDRDHQFRTGKTKLIERGIVNDNFGEMAGEAFAASGYKAFSPMFGDSNVFTLPYFETLRKSSYLFSYGCGGGYYNSCAGVGTTDSFAKDSIQSGFTMLFGSYFGDWDNQNNFLRAPLASKGNCLTSVWSGRPHWIFHSMAMGIPFSESIKVSQWDTNSYFRHPNQIFGRLRQIAFMGDPSLKMYYPESINGLKLNVMDDNLKKQSEVNLVWNTTKGSEYYNVYKSKSLDGVYSKINSSPVKDTFYKDLKVSAGKQYYIVKSVNLKLTASGSFFNESSGITDSASALFFGIGIEKINPVNKVLSFYPNPAKNEIHLNGDFSIFKTNLLSFYAIDGKLIKQVLLNESTISLTDIPEGLYFIEVVKDGIHWANKIVISKN